MDAAPLPYKSVELCGGTHARRLGDIGLFRIVGDRAIAAGVRRIEATTGLNSLHEAQERDRALLPLLKALGADAPSALAKLDKMLTDERALQKKVAELEKKIAVGGGGGTSPRDFTSTTLEAAHTHAGFKSVAVRNDGADMATLRELAEKVRDRLAQGSDGAVVLLGSGLGGKAQLVLTVSKGLTTRFKAGELIRPIAAIVGGSGGGRPDMAQAGGTQVEKLDEALRQLDSLLG
jgi:alanyl-tRNA synthetase